MASANYEEQLEFFSIKVPDGPLTSRLQHLEGRRHYHGQRQADRHADPRQPDAGANLYLLATGTGLAPFLSVIKDPETYERYEKIVLVHGCRQVAELAYERLITEELPRHEFLGELISRQADLLSNCHARALPQSRQAD